ncbi:MAG: bifunctional UDP-N-acetylglucosamine diphosphorylase/glucosamine-1-phosphate N-acetyltransferase GlmU [Corynebacteriales bacterium]|nr:bifunctional UDP-N-acetylglucosamine diphosphorylase/glucosamine-1-phosphate N-acetyltransferase GlmU [Mycobacteriales bacterium]
MNPPAAVIILAAGQGTRMRSSTPKVLHTLAGRSLLGHVAHVAAELNPQHLVAVVGHEAERVSAHLAELEVPISAARQTEQRGTGDAVRAALQSLPTLEGTVVVLNGDAPLLTPETLRQLIDEHGDNAATVLTALVPNPTGMGRIVRDATGALNAIVEERDADDTQRAIHEVNSGVFAFDARKLQATLGKLTTDNAQNQEYLTDVIALLRAANEPVGALQAHDYRETLGCNDRAELSILAGLLRDRLNERWMRAGVTMIDPATIWLDVTVELAPDVILEPGVQLKGVTRVESGAIVGPDSTLVDTTVAAQARVVRSHCVGARVGPSAEVGPFAYLRPQTDLGKDTKAGAFVEVKNATVGEGSKVPHLTYVGDATIGVHSNIGASSVFVNYDGVDKHHTTIGDHCRTGSDTMFVAPVTIGDGAYTAAGTVITIDVPPGALAVARAPQRNLEGWVQKRRAGSAAALAAARATQHISGEK